MHRLPKYSIDEPLEESLLTSLSFPGQRITQVAFERQASLFIADIPSHRVVMITVQYHQDEGVAQRGVLDNPALV
jgi:hypothetical protein